jgi:hypothetical protein
LADVTNRIELILLIVVTIVGVGRWIGQMGDPRDVQRYDARLQSLEGWRGHAEAELEKHSDFRDSSVRRFADIEASLKARDREDERRRGDR